MEPQIVQPLLNTRRLVAGIEVTEAQRDDLLSVAQHQQGAARVARNEMLKLSIAVGRPIDQLAVEIEHILFILAWLAGFH